jgi:hypothetical protein
VSIAGLILFRVRVIISLVIIITGVTSLSAQQGVGKDYAFSEGYRFEILNSSPYSVSLIYRAGEAKLTGITNDYGSFYRMVMSGHHPIPDPGKPELPVISKLVTTPEYSGYRVTYNNVLSTTINPEDAGLTGLLFPAQPGTIKSQIQEKQKFMIDTDVYMRDRFTGTDTVLVNFEGELRGDRLSTISVIPARYNPVQNLIEIIVSMEIKIEFIPSTKSEEDGYNYSKIQAELNLTKGIKSFSHEQLINGYSENPVGMIILTDTSFSKIIKPLVEWKTRKGFRITTLYKGAALAGSTNTELKDTLRKIYLASTPEMPPPQYLLIIGDLSIIPKSPGTSNLSDLYYGEFTGGTDYIPEMYIGRLPAKDTAQVRSMVDKILQYERFEFADTNKFYTNALITAGNDGGYATYMNGHINYANSYYINTANGLNTTAWQHPQSALMDDSLKFLLNQGLGFLNYTGHGAADRWEDPLFTNLFIDSLSGERMYPFVVSNACRTSEFDLAGNLATAFVTARNKGAIGFIGCSNDSYWLEDFYYAVGATSVSLNPEYSPENLGFYDRLFHLNSELPSKWFYTMGQVNFAGNLAVTSSTTYRKKYYWETYHLLGDPSLIPIIGEPTEITANLPATLPTGITSLYITAPPFTYAAVSDGRTLWDASFVGPSGYTILEIPESPGDSCIVVLTGQNHKPLIKTIFFGEPAGPYINASLFTLDDLTGNNNGKADYNESIYLGLSVTNLGNSVSSDAYVTISSASEWVTIIQDSTFIGDILAKSTEVLGKAFQVSIKNSVPNLGIISFQIAISDNDTTLIYMHDLTVYAPELSITGIRIDDLAEGNGNLLPDRGETMNLIFSISNNGLSATEGFFRIANNPEGILIYNPEVGTGLIEPGAVVEVILRATVSESSQPGYKIVLETFVDCGYYNDAGTFTISIGKTRESFEYGNFTIFPWINKSTVPWVVTSDQSYDGIMSAASGQISHNGVTKLQINLDMPESDTVKFWYRVSSEPSWDFFSFLVDGTKKLEISGESDWKKYTVVLPPGSHVLEWVYSKDGSVSGGTDRVWIDLIDFPVSAFADRDIEVAWLISPFEKDEYGDEDVSIVLKNMGSRAINGFNAAYSVSGLIVHEWEYFSDTIPYRDSVIVTFNKKLDLSRYAIYDLKIYTFDNDDDFKQNDTLSVRIENTRIKAEVRAFPNPFSDMLKIHVNTIGEQPVTLSVNNILGRKLITKQATLLDGDNTIILDTDLLPPGTYIITIEGDIISHRIKVIKL